jgi:sugar O-acyltransferase (sialic acid O-acetyltransferase NeuD family)
MNKDIYILGVGHNTPVYIELAEMLGYNVVGLYHYEDSRVGELVYNIPIIGSNEQLFAEKDLSERNFALSMGNNALRVTLAMEIRKRGGIIPTLIHPTASVSKYAKIAEGVVVHANSVVQADVEIMQDSVISFNVGVTHNSIIEKGCYIAGQTIVGAYVHIEENVFVGMGSVIVSSKVPVIGQNAIIGAGSVVLKPVKANTIVVGNPATELKK